MKDNIKNYNGFTDNDNEEIFIPASLYSGTDEQIGWLVYTALTNKFYDKNFFKKHSLDDFVTEKLKGKSFWGCCRHIFDVKDIMNLNSDYIRTGYVHKDIIRSIEISHNNLNISDYWDDVLSLSEYALLSDARKEQYIYKSWADNESEEYTFHALQTILLEWFETIGMNPNMPKDMSLDDLFFVVTSKRKV